MNEDTVTYYVKESREEGKWKEVLEINLWQFYQKCPIQNLLTTTDNHITRSSKPTRGQAGLRFNSLLCFLILYETEIYQLIYFSEQMILWNQFVI